MLREFDEEWPEAHVAMMKYWHELYGAELVGNTHDSVEMQLARPPTDRDQAKALAWEQYIYCYDLVEQVFQSFPALAAALLGGKAWYLWWD